MYLNRNRSKGLSFLAAVASLCLMYGCDMLESDVSPKTPELELTTNEIYVTQNGTGIIDLNSMIKSSGAVRLDITGQPLNGNLSKLSNTVLRSWC
jgi:hypothetical protein